MNPLGSRHPVFVHQPVSSCAVWFARTKLQSNSMSGNLRMRRIHEIALAVGIALLSAALSWNHTPPPPVGWFIGIGVVISFVLSIVLALTLTLRPRQKPLPIRTAFSLFLSASGLSLIIVCGVHDFWIPLSSLQSFLLLISLMCVLFIVPWVFTEFRIRHRTPIVFDAALTPFIAGLATVSAFSKPIEMFWAPEFWRVLGLPSILITYFVMRAALRHGHGTLLPLSACSAIVFIILA